MKGLNLIEDIANTLSLEYISDIKEEENFGIILEMVHQLKADDYSLQNWEDVLTYIKGEECRMNSSEEAKELLEEILGDRKV